MLAEFKNNNINLTKIQSLPIIGSPFQYSFYVDLEWSDRRNFDRAISRVLTLVSNLSVLGEYRGAKISN